MPYTLDSDLVSKRVDFVSGHNGTTLEENILLGVCGPLSVLLANLAIPWFFPARNFLTGRCWDAILKLTLDFLLTIMPSLLAYTVMSDNVMALLIIQALVALAIGVFSLCEYAYLDGEKPSLREALRQPVFLRRPLWISYAKANTLIATGICILAVDLPIFPRRFAKSATYGYGLMDVGVGVFVFTSGVAAHEIRKRANRLSLRIMKAVPLVCLGLVRLAAVKALNYQEVVDEYGVHWNFFFTLAFVKIMSSLLGTVLPMRKVSGVLGVAIAVGYEFFLDRFQLKPVLLALSDGDPAADRVGFLDANREGLVSSIGFLAIHFLGMQLGTFLIKERVRLKEWVRCVVQMVVLTAVSHVAVVSAHQLWEPPSRRLANLTYTLWMVSYSLWYATAFMVVELMVLLGGALRLPLYSYSVISPFEQLEPNLWRHVSDNGSAYFLICNLLTGAVNVLYPADLAELDSLTSFGILIAYSYTLVLIVYVGIRLASNSSNNPASAAAAGQQQQQQQQQQHHSVSGAGDHHSSNISSMSKNGNTS